MSEERVSIVEGLENLIKEKGVQEVTITWDGGNDSGCFYLQFDGHDVDYDEYPILSACVDTVADELGYGSFAGEYNTSGTLTYDPSLSCFSGEKFESFDKYEDVKVEIKLEIPDHIWFDSLGVEIEDDMRVSVRVEVKNGPVLDEHVDLEYSLSNFIEESISYSKNIGSEDRCYHSIEFDLKDFIHDEEKKVRYVFIKSLNITSEEQSEGSVNVSLKDVFYYI